MTDTAIIIIGAGGHAAVVADALLAAGQKVVGFVDPDPSRHGQWLCGLPILGDDDILSAMDRARLRLANGIGGTRGEGLRAFVQHRLVASGWHFVGLRHPSSVISPFARIATCAHVLAGSVVQPGAVVGVGCIVNSGAVIEHDADLGAFVHVACNATLCGAVRVGEHSHVGAAAVVRQGVSLGARTVVGAGAVVVRDFAGGGVLIGVPARPIEDVGQ